MQSSLESANPDLADEIEVLKSIYSDDFCALPPGAWGQQLRFAIRCEPITRSVLGGERERDYVSVLEGERDRDRGERDYVCVRGGGRGIEKEIMCV